MCRRICFLIILLLLNIVAYGQNSYYYSKHISLPPQNITEKTVNLQYPIKMENVKAIGMGNTQVAIGKNFNAMMYNPALLGKARNRLELFGIRASLPPDTYDAAFFLRDNKDEFLEAISLSQIWDGVNTFFEPVATAEQKLEALKQIQEGMQFTIDLMSKVVGDSKNPKQHGLSVLPTFGIQVGNFGFSLYGFGHSGFVVQQSPTLEALLGIDVPDNFNDLVQVEKAVAQMMGTLSTVLTDDESFNEDVYPIAFYISYVDIVGALGYGFNIDNNLMIGANLKVVNRRFSTDRIPVIDYNKILSDAWDRLQSNVTGVTFDIGAFYQTQYGTSFGLALQNIVPMQTIKKSINTEFRYPDIYYDRDENDKIITNSLGDTALISSYRQVNITRPYNLKVPFLASIGMCQPITKNWDLALEWYDIIEQDSRYSKTTQRIRFGTEYRLKFLNDYFMASFRSGFADEKFCFGLGLCITRFVQIDGAYAYDRFVKSYSYFTQLRIGW